MIESLDLEVHANGVEAVPRPLAAVDPVQLQGRGQLGRHLRCIADFCWYRYRRERRTHQRWRRQRSCEGLSDFCEHAKDEDACGAMELGITS